jgi:hypothetical protein
MHHLKHSLVIAKVEIRMKLKFIVALLGLIMAIPGGIIAQNQDDQPQDQNAKPSPNIPMQGPNDQGSMDQDQADQDAADRRAAANGNPTNQPSDQPSAPPSDQPRMTPGPNDPGPNSNSNDPNSGNQSYNTPAPEEKNGVARISLIHGDVSTQRGDSKDWSAAALNGPVVAGDRVSTGDKARVELELDYANTLRLAEHSQANLTQLTHSQIQIQLARGMANYTVYKSSDADAEIDTPNVAIRTERRESSFRILVSADDHTEVLVRKGEIEVTTPQGGTRVGQGQYITIQGAGADEQYKIGEAPARDDWDQWNADRDNMIRNNEARRHTNDYYVGTENLDGHGTWSEVPDYGPVWRPNVPPDWAPYRNGRWVYEPYWGWTWVSYDDWGWAPYHYGRWMYVGGGWGWWPGPAYGYPFYRPIWAPAYVSFFGPGFGVGFGVGFGFGFGVGWLPLGPGDFFHPWWGRWGGGFGYARFGEFNHGGFAPLRAGSRFSNVNLAMHDRNFRGATSVSGKEFGSAHMNAQAMTHAQMQNARFNTGRLSVSPTRESMSASGRPAAASTTRNASQNQHFFSTRAAAASAGTGRSFNNSSSSERSSNERSTGTARETARSGNSTGAREGGGWQRFSPMARSSSESARTGEAAGRTSSDNRSMGGGESRSAESRSPYGSSRSASPESRGYGSAGRGYGGGYSRPPLNMRQPIVTPRSYGGGAYGGRSSGYGGGRSAPSFGGHSAPSSHGGAPRRRTAAVGTVEVATVDMGGKTTLGPFPA